MPRKRQSKHPPHDPQRSEAHHAAKSRCESLRYPAIAAILLPADIAGNTPARTDAIHPSRPYGSLDRQPVGQPPAMDRSRAMPRRAGPDRSWSSIPTHCRSCRRARNHWQETTRQERCRPSQRRRRSCTGMALPGIGHQLTARPDLLTPGVRRSAPRSRGVLPFRLARNHTKPSRQKTDSHTPSPGLSPDATTTRRQSRGYGKLTPSPRARESIFSRR